MCTLTPGTDAGEWVGYQILTGAGRGIVTQLVSHLRIAKKEKNGSSAC